MHEGPTSAGSPGGAGDDSPQSRERRLIEEAMKQATPREGSGAVLFPGDLPAPDAFPGYEILREIHRGGQGVVYQAIQKTTRRKVAIKLLHGGPFTGSTGRSRFEREVQVLGQLSHANIVRIHDSGVTADGSFFYVMDYISGRSLDELIADKRPDVDQTLALFVKICDAINAAHLKGIIHRDIKPSNIRVDANGEPIIVDFGLAKIAVPDVIEGEGMDKSPQLMTLTGQFIGSLPWASPEQAEGLPGNIDVRTDVYSLGVVLYQMLTGQFPYRVIGNMRDVLDNILKAQPARPSTVRRQIDDEVETIVLKCLSKDRDRRYQSAGELGRDLKRYLQGQPIEAKRDSTAYMLGKALHRYRVPVALASAAVVALVIVAVWMSVLYRQADRATQRATQALAAERTAREAEDRQRARAERNFKAGHDLAMSMIGDISKELTYLRGATRARELLLKQAQGYLARLETEAGDDPDLLLDLAKAHEQVGDLQGVIYMRRLGETSQAEQNHARALALRSALAARLPDDPRVHAALARSHYRTGGAAQQRGDLPGAGKAYAQALAEYDRALELVSAGGGTPDPLWGDSRAWTLRAAGDICRLQGRAAAQGGDLSAGLALMDQASGLYDRAEQAWRERLTRNPGDEDAQRGVGVIRDLRGACLLAIAGGHAAAAAKALDAGKPDDARTHLDAALQRVERAREHSQASLDHFRTLAAVNTASGEIRRHVMVATRSVALTHSESARLHARLAPLDPAADHAAQERLHRERALDLHRQSAAIARRLGDEDTRSTEARRDLAGCLNDVGNELRALGRLDEAEPVLAESLALRAEIQAADPLERHAQDLGVGLLRMGQFRLEQAKALQGPAQGERARDALDLLTRAGEALGPLAQSGVAGVQAQADEARRLADEARALSGPQKGG
jgi:tetratricopeptide (TPR) repeat protein/predicted Ser/Thr protein kinase